MFVCVLPRAELVLPPAPGHANWSKVIPISLQTCGQDEPRGCKGSSSEGWGEAFSTLLEESLRVVLFWFSLDIAMHASKALSRPSCLII